MDNKTLQQELDALRNENASLKKTVATQESRLTASNSLSFKATPKGGVSVYGLGRFPVTLYANQWKRLMEVKGDIINFVETNIRNGTIPADKPAKAVETKATV